MGSSKNTIRILSFLGVLILSGSLLLGLFQEARAVNITVTNVPSNIGTSDTVTFTASIEVPQGEKLPISSVRTVVEKTSAAGPSLSDKADPTVSADATCPASAGPGLPNCASSSAFSSLNPSSSNAVTKVEFTGGSPGNLEGYGYELCTNAPGGVCTVTHTGYDFTAGRGYGYEQPGQHGSSYDLTDSTGGYGYDSGTLTLNWDITVDAGNLDGGGNYWLTFIVNTDSSILGKLEGKAQYFSVSATTPGGGGGPGGGVSTGPITTGLGDSFDVDADQKVRVTSGLPSGITAFGVTFNQACDGCSLHITRSSAPPSGTPGTPSGFSAVSFWTIEVRDSDGNVLDGYISEGYLEFEVTQDELPGQAQPPQILLLRYDNGWRAQDTSLTSSATADPLVYNGTLTGFSSFAVAADTEAPSISNVQPTGSTSAVTPTISADWSDNRGIDTDSLTLTVDGTEQTSAMGSLDVTEDGFTFVPGESLEQGEHTVTATVSDLSELQTTRSWDFRVSDVTCPQPPRITQVQPADGATDVALDTTITVTVQEGSCPIADSSLTVNGDSVSATYANGALTATLPSAIGNEETVSVTAQVTDTGDNAAERSWSFDTEQAEEPGPPTDDGGGALVWIIIAIVVLAIVGVGAYFYTQQEGGGGGGM